MAITLQKQNVMANAPQKREARQGEQLQEDQARGGDGKIQTIYKIAGGC